MNLADRLGHIGRRRWVLRSALILICLIVLFGLFGYLLLPGIIKSQAEKAVSAALHRTLTIERVQVRPFSLAMAVEGVKLMEPDGHSVFASLQRLQVQVSASSLLHLAPVVKHLRLTGPFVHLARVGPNRYSTDDILAALSGRPADSAASADKASGKPSRFSIYNIQVEGGRFELDDQPEGAHHTVSDLNIGIPFISSLPSQEEVFVEPFLSAIVNGAPLTIRGKALPFADSKEAVVDLDLDNVDLPGYLKYLPFEPRFKLAGARLDLHLQASFQQPPARPPLLALSGRASIKSLQLSDLQDRPLVKLPELTVMLGRSEPLEGRIVVSTVAINGLEVNLARDAKHQLNMLQLVPPERKQDAAPTAAPAAKPGSQSGAGGGPAINLSVGQVAIQDAGVRLTDSDPARPLSGSVERFAMTLTDLSLDLQSRRLQIGDIRSASANFSLQQGKAPAGHDVAAASQTARAPRAAAPQAPGPGRDAEAFAVAVGNVAISDWSARIESLGLPQPAVTTISGLGLAAQGLSTGAGAPATIDLKAIVSKKGALSVTGALGLAPLHADLKLDLKSVDLLALQPYVTDRINLLVTRADLSARGHLAIDQDAKGGLKGGFQGEATLGNLATIDKVNSNDFLNWKSLFFRGVNLRLEPLALDIEQIALSEFFARVIVDPAGRINLQDVVRGQADEQRSLTDADAKPAPPAEETAARAMPPITIGAVNLKAGSVRFTDNFIRPNYTANLAELEGGITGLSSRADSAATVDLHGQVNGAPLTIAGQINPIKGDLFVDLKAGVHGMELAPLSAYSGKYVGYGIERGKLSFDVAYKLDHRKLSAENRLVLDQLTFGDKIASPSATSLPVQLAVALLKDRNGVIDVNLPIGGSLDDPQFSVGGVIVKVIINLVTKAVTSPFALLGSLFGGGEELSFIEFDAGRTDIAQAQQSRLKTLAAALTDRPGLKLEVTARVDPAGDREGLARENLERMVRALKVKDLVAKGESATVDTVEVAPEEYPVLLGRVYDAENPGKPRSGAGTKQAMPTSDLENALMAGAPVGDDELLALGDRRAQSVKQWLMTQGQVPEARIFLVATRLADSAGSAQSAEPAQSVEPADAARAAPAPQTARKPSRVEFSLK